MNQTTQRTMIERMEMRIGHRPNYTYKLSAPQLRKLAYANEKARRERIERENIQKFREEKQKQKSAAAGSAQPTPAAADSKPQSPAGLSPSLPAGSPAPCQTSPLARGTIFTSEAEASK